MGAVGRRQARFRERGDGSRFPGWGGKGKGREGRGGGGWEGAAAARVRDGAAAVAAPLTPACLGALCLCPTMLYAGSRAGKGRGRGWGEPGVGGDPQFWRKRRRSGSQSTDLDCGRLILLTVLGFDTVCAPLRTHTRADLHYTLQKLWPVCLSSSFTFSSLSACTTEAFLGMAHACSFSPFELKTKETLFSRVASVARLKPEHPRPFGELVIHPYFTLGNGLPRGGPHRGEGSTLQTAYPAGYSDSLQPFASLGILSVP